MELCNHKGKCGENLEKHWKHSTLCPGLPSPAAVVVFTNFEANFYVAAGKKHRKYFPVLKSSVTHIKS